MKLNLKKGFCFTAVIAVICAAAFVFAGRIEKPVNKEVFAAGEPEIIMQINDPVMTVDGKKINIDENGTAPIIVNGRTLVPIRTVIENIGGNVQWDNSTRQTTLNYKNNKIVLTVGSKTAYLNDSENTLDTAPEIINGRTMLPIRFIAEGFKFGVNWNKDTQTITITSKGIKENETVAEENRVGRTCGFGFDS